MSPPATHVLASLCLSALGCPSYSERFLLPLRLAIDCRYVALPSGEERVAILEAVTRNARVSPEVDLRSIGTDPRTDVSRRIPARPPICSHLPSLLVISAGIFGCGYGCLTTGGGLSCAQTAAQALGLR